MAYKKNRVCGVEGCSRPSHANGLCDTHYRQKIRGTATSAVRKPTLEENLADRIFTAIKAKRGTPFTLESLSNMFDVGVNRIRIALAKLQADGKNVHVEEGFGIASVPEGIPTLEDTLIDVRKFAGNEIRFGLTADNHLCSKYARMDVLNALFDIWLDQGIHTVLQAGNMIDGESRFNRYDLVTRPGIEAQAEYLIQEWPYRDGMTTEFVPGDDHEGWYVQREGINIVKYLQDAANRAGRNDMFFKGYMEHVYTLGAENGASNMSLIHAGGGSAYATSYTVQKIVESYQPNEKPSILLVGHFHKAEFSYPRSVLTVQAGCTQDQTPFLRKKRIEAMVGGWTLSFTLDNNGIVHGFSPQWHPFYDRDFYRRWSYHFKPKTKPERAK